MACQHFQKSLSSSAEICAHTDTFNSRMALPVCKPLQSADEKCTLTFHLEDLQVPQKVTHQRKRRFPIRPSYFSEVQRPELSCKRRYPWPSAARLVTTADRISVFWLTKPSEPLLASLRASSCHEAREYVGNLGFQHSTYQRLCSCHRVWDPDKRCQGFREPHVSAEWRAAGWPVRCSGPIRGE